MGPKNVIVIESSGSREMDSEDRTMELMELMEQEESPELVAWKCISCLGIGRTTFLRITTSI